jgi:hypothetical protein
MTSTERSQIGCSLFAAGSAFAIPFAAPTYRTVCALFREDVAVFASVFDRIQRRQRPSAKRIYSQGHRFKVIRVDATAVKAWSAGTRRILVVAQMVKRHARGDWSPKTLVDISVGVIAPAVTSTDTVARGGVDAMQPVPTSAVLDFPLGRRVSVLVPVDELPGSASHQTLACLGTLDQFSRIATPALADAERDIIGLHRTYLRCQTPAVSAVRGHFASSNYTRSLRVEAV